MKRVADYAGIMPRVNVSLFILMLFCWLSTSAQAQVVVYRVNAGGRTTQAADVTYPDWGADEQAALEPAPIQFARNGTPSIYVNEEVAGDQTAGRNQDHNLLDIDNPAAGNEVFVTQRWDPVDVEGNMTWSFPVSVERTYQINLYFSEMFGEGLETREFDIFIEDVLEEDNFNVLEITGNKEKVGVQRSYTVVAGDASLDIEFVNQEAPAGTILPAMINAIEIVDVNAANLPPTIAAIGDQENLEGQFVSIQVEATDPDDFAEVPGKATIVSYIAENLPPGLGISETGLISGTIEFDAEDVYDTRIIVLDGGFPTAGAIENIRWTIGNGSPTVLNPIEDYTRFHGDPADVIDLSTVFDDPLGEGVAYTIEGNDNQSVVSESISGAEVTLSYSTTVEGSANIRVRATNTSGEFAEDEFVVSVIAGNPQALVQVTPNGNLGASTFDGSSIRLENTSPSDVQIVSVSMDLSTALYPDLVFDPTGAAGDSGAKCLVADGGEEDAGYINPANNCVDPFSDANEGGFNVVTLNFNDFDPGEVFLFSVDVDPTSIKGNPNVGDAGSVGGIEMIGATVTVNFSNESSATTELFRIHDSPGGSEAVVRANPVAEPTIAIAGVEGSTATVSDQSINIEVSGLPGQIVRLFQSDGRLNLRSVPNGGFDIEPYEANEAIGGVWEYAGVIDGDGTISIPVTLRQSSHGDAFGLGGLNHFIAVTESEQLNSHTSNKLVVELEVASTVELVDGWNMVGISYNVGSSNYAAIYGDASPTQAPYFWGTASYVQTEDMNAGVGYWLDVSGESVITISGTEVTQVTLALESGWNMISGPSCFFDLDFATDPSSIIIPNTLFGFAGAYVSAAGLDPNLGYWLKTSAAGTVTFDCGNTTVAKAPNQAADELVVAPHASFGVLRISDEKGHQQDLYFGAELADKAVRDQYNMPPIYHEGFDARYADNYRLVEGNRGVVKVRGEFPLTFEVAKAPNAGGDLMIIEALDGDQVVDTYQVMPGEPVAITNDRVTALRLGSDELDAAATLPASFALNGNYPNPFNPTTTIVFDLPEDATMQVGIFDLLGRQVMALDAVDMTAGASRQLQIDASSLASGTYLYKVQAQMASGSVVSTGRMTLLK